MYGPTIRAACNSRGQGLTLYNILSERKNLNKTNDFYYKPNSAPAVSVGGSCNRALIKYKKKRT